MTYKDFIEVFRSRGIDPEQGYDIHHIKPRCLGGTDDPDNLVKLTLFEHFFAHYLLALEGNSGEMLFNFWARFNWKLSDSERKYLTSLPSWDALIKESLDNKSKVRKEFYTKNGSPLKGRTLSDEIRKKLSDAHKGKPSPNKGKKLTEEQKASKKPNPYEWKKGHTPWNKGHSVFAGENNPFFGKCHSEETKAKIIEKKTGMHWWNNGTNSTQAKECPEGYVPGRIIKKDM